MTYANHDFDNYELLRLALL